MLARRRESSPTAVAGSSPDLVVAWTPNLAAADRLIPPEGAHPLRDKALVYSFAPWVSPPGVARALYFASLLIYAAESVSFTLQIVCQKQASIPEGFTKPGLP
jgi:hypothetical protein